MFTYPIINDFAKASDKRVLGLGVPDSQYMIPGKTYAGRLPGHSRKAFVRKRDHYSTPIPHLADLPTVGSFGPGTFYKVERRTKMPRWLRSMFGSDYDYYDDRYRKRSVIYTDGAHHGSSAGRTVTSTRQVCSACGKFRSPSWSARHPLRYGEIPTSSMCRKCMGKSTSSAETPYYPRRRRRRYHRSHPRYSDCTEDLYSSHDSTDPYHLRRQYKSDSLGYIRPRSLVRSGSGEGVNIVIQNGGYAPNARVRTVSSSDDAVRVTHRIAVDRPIRRRTFRSVSSDPAFTDEFMEEVLPRRRPLSHARARSRSSVHFVDELEGSRYHRRPRNLSRHSSGDDFIESRPYSYSHRRRRPLYCDGAADHQKDSNGTDRNSAKKKVNNSEGNEENSVVNDPLQWPVVSPDRQTLSGPSDKFFPPVTLGQARLPAKPLRIDSNVSPDEYGHADFEKLYQDLNGHTKTLDPPRSANHTCKLTNRARVAFADPGYEVDSQFPSPPSVTFAVPAHCLTQTISPLPVREMPLPMCIRDNQCSRGYTEPLSPAYSDDRAFTAIPCQKSYERVRFTDPPLSPPKSSQDSNPSVVSSSPKLTRVDVAATMADETNHPDHLAYLLSTAQISQSHEKKTYGQTEEDVGEGLTYATSGVDAFDDRPPSFHKYTKPGSTVSSLDGCSEEDGTYQTGFKIGTGEKEASSMDTVLDHSDKDYYDEPPPRRVAMHDIFDKNELEQRYYKTQVDYQAEGRAHMQALKERRATQGAIYQ